jgi:hypothetical protein
VARMVKMRNSFQVLVGKTGRKSTWKTSTGAWISSLVSCGLSGCLCDGQITRPQESHGVCVSECEFETSKMWRPDPLGLWSRSKKKK